MALELQEQQKQEANKLEHSKMESLFLHFQAQQNVGDKDLTKVQLLLVVEVLKTTKHTKDLNGDTYK